jgi:hypothetical protein
MELTKAAQEMHQIRKDLDAHIEAAKQREAELRGQIRERANILSSAVEGLDLDKVNLAKTVVYVQGSFERGGADRAAVIEDAIKQLATGSPVRQGYGDLWEQYFGTKNYDVWVGQRSDHAYGYGPRHGGICFAVGVIADVRKSRPQATLTPEEVEAAIYYLTNIQRVQEAERKASQQAAA